MLPYLRETFVIPPPHNCRKQCKPHWHSCMSTGTLDRIGHLGCNLSYSLEINTSTTSYFHAAYALVCQNYIQRNWKYISRNAAFEHNKNISLKPLLHRILQVVSWCTFVEIEVFSLCSEGTFADSPHLSSPLCCTAPCGLVAESEATTLWWVKSAATQPVSVRTLTTHALATCGLWAFPHSQVQQWRRGFLKNPSGALLPPPHCMLLMLHLFSGRVPKFRNGFFDAVGAVIGGCCGEEGMGQVPVQEFPVSRQRVRIQDFVFDAVFSFTTEPFKLYSQQPDIGSELIVLIFLYTGSRMPHPYSILGTQKKSSKKQITHFGLQFYILFPGSKHHWAWNLLLSRHV